jgi:phosphate transport system ATP-binding protein
MSKDPVVDSSSSPVLVIDNLSAWIEKLQVLREISFAVPRDEITAVIGPSGSGKSILLKTMVGLLQEELEHTLYCEGDIRYQGQSILGIRDEMMIEELRRRIAYVSQVSVAFPMSIYDNVRLGISYWAPGIRKMRRDEMIEGSLRKVGLWDEVKTRLWSSAANLSAGQLQRLAFARALALEPEVLVLDEPCAYTDPISTARIEELLMDLRGHYTMLIVTHNMQQASRISDQVLFLYMGELIEVSSAEKLFINPSKKQTEDFITGRFG